MGIDDIHIRHCRIHISIFMLIASRCTCFTVVHPNRYQFNLRDNRFVWRLMSIERSAHSENVKINAESSNSKVTQGLNHEPARDSNHNELFLSSCNNSVVADHHAATDGLFPEWSFQPRDFFRFEILYESKISQARVGRIHTPHGIIDTPSFVAVATNAALKGVDFRQADLANQQLIFANTYHLMLHPGADIIEAAGGIHKWTNRQNRPFITDSGGFQVFSLAYGSVHDDLNSNGELKRSAKGQQSGNLKRNVLGDDAVKVSEDGVIFRSYRDGTKFLLTPETTVQAQKKIGADIIIPLDELPGYYTDRSTLEKSVERTHRWETRSLHEHLKNVNKQAMYAVIHGGIDKEFRMKSVNYLTSLPFDGYAIGGSLGNGKLELKDLLSWLMPMFDVGTRKEKPRHLLGIADEESVRNAVSRGVDTLDSCYPTRLGRHGTVLSREGNIRLRSGTHKKSFGVKIQEDCSCQTCQHYDRAYLWHLFKANEPIAITLATLHNIHYMNELMLKIRSDIMEGNL
jgi:queuine tRNA-ribosyltransferase